MFIYQTNMREMVLVVWYWYFALGGYDEVTVKFKGIVLTRGH